MVLSWMTTLSTGHGGTVTMGMERASASVCVGSVELRNELPGEGVEDWLQGNVAGKSIILAQWHHDGRV